MLITKAQGPMEEHMVRIPLCPLNKLEWLYNGGAPNQLVFLTMNEVKDDMKLMNEDMKWHEVEGLKVKSVCGMKLNPEKAQKSYIPHYNGPPPWWGRDSNSRP